MAKQKQRDAEIGKEEKRIKLIKLIECDKCRRKQSTKRNQEEEEKMEQNQMDNCKNHIKLVFFWVKQDQRAKQKFGKK